MTFSLTSTLKTAAVCFSAVAAARLIDEGQFCPGDIIVKDVVILGGGASGSYAAVRLKDAGKSVVVVEKKDHLGGHVDTYTDPTTSAPIDFGVLAYFDLPGVKDFFARFDVSIEAAPQSPLVTKYIDFATGLPVSNYPGVNQTEILAALGAYAQISAQYTNYTFPGYFDFPDQVPEDLALPFGQFLAKYNLLPVLSVIWTFILGLGDVLSVPTLFALQNFNAIHINDIQQPGGVFIPSSHNNSQLYGAIQDFLAPDLLLSSTVSVANRTDSGVKLVVSTPGGKKLIKAKKLLVTAAPTTDNLKKLDLDTAETSVFAKWQWSSYYVGIVSHTGLPDGLDIVNISPDSSPSSLDLPETPFVAELAFTGLPGLYRTTVVADEGLDEHRAKLLVRDAVNKLGDAGTFNTTHLDFEDFSDHSPLQLRVSAEDLKAGFIKQLYALQGRSSTFYTGAAWAADLTSILWVFTETGILPQILAAI